MLKLLRVLLLSTLVLAFAGLAQAAEKTLVNGIDADFPPFASVDKTGKAIGFDVESLDWIAKEMGFKVKHQPTAWDGIVASLVAKKIDVIASGMSITPERAAQVAFSVPYWTVTQVLVTKADSALTPDAALVEGKKIGVQRGTSEAKWIQANLLDKGVKKFEMIEYDSSALAIEDILNGRIDAAAMDDAPAKEALAAKKPVKIIGQFGMEPEKFGYAVRKGDAELLAKINKGLEKLMASPKWEELKTKYSLR